MCMCVVVCVCVCVCVCGCGWDCVVVGVISECVGVIAWVFVGVIA